MDARNLGNIPHTHWSPPTPSHDAYTYTHRFSSQGALEIGIAPSPSPTDHIGESPEESSG
ncbi:hypothetical protein RJ641_003227 [Dillenia turbinata]|uniref:Uncharacterized protein n=1 Tax=Dillenia turbinata TaxID=194707 RepID=A0AAN8VDF4_9MAGN